MTRFFFNLRHGTCAVDDRHGLVLESVADARACALQIACDWVAEHGGQTSATGYIEVVAAHGASIMRVRFVDALRTRRAESGGPVLIRDACA